MGAGQEFLPLAEKLLVFDSFWERESQFSETLCLVIWTHTRAGYTPQTIWSIHTRLIEGKMKTTQQYHSWTGRNVRVEIIVRGVMYSKRIIWNAQKALKILQKETSQSFPYKIIVDDISILIRLTMFFSFNLTQKVMPLGRPEDGPIAWHIYTWKMMLNNNGDWYIVVS